MRTFLKVYGYALKISTVATLLALAAMRYLGWSTVAGSYRELDLTSLDTSKHLVINDAGCLIFVALGVGWIIYAAARIGSMSEDDNPTGDL